MFIIIVDLLPHIDDDLNVEIKYLEIVFINRFIIVRLVVPLLLSGILRISYAFVSIEN